MFLVTESVQRRNRWPPCLSSVYACTTQQNWIVLKTGGSSRESRTCDGLSSQHLPPVPFIPGRKEAEAMAKREEGSVFRRPRSPVSLQWCPQTQGSGQRPKDCNGPSRKTGNMPETLVTSPFEYKTIETLNANKLEIFYWGKKKKDEAYG